MGEVRSVQEVTWLKSGRVKTVPEPGQVGSEININGSGKQYRAGQRQCEQHGVNKL